MKNRDISPIDNHSVWSVGKIGSVKQPSFIKETKNESVDLAREQKDYNKLRELGLRVPRSRLFPDRKKLLVEGAGVPLGSIFFENPSLTLQVFKSALNDLLAIWEKTKTDIDETRLERDYVTGSLKILEKLESLPLDQNKPMAINGTEYPSLQETINQCRNNLLTIKERVMVISHGDEYSSNITAEKNSKGVFTGKHMFIDPRDVGYYRLSSLLNIIWGQTLLHNFKFQSSLEEQKEKIVINYHITSEQQEMFEQFFSLMQNFTETVETRMGVKAELLRDLLFCNLARTLDSGTYQQRYNEKIHPFRFAFFAIAMQIFYRSDLAKTKDR